jgi:spermidine/putrescine transport system substrate-binding protein
VSDERLDATLKLVDYLLGADYGAKLAVGGPYALSTSLAREKLTEEQQEKIFVKDLSIMDSFVWKANPARYSDWVRLWNEVKAS